MNSKALLMPLHIHLVSVSLGDDRVFFQKLVGSFIEGFFFKKLPALMLAAQFQIPVLCKVLGFSEAIFPCARTKILVVEKR